MQRYAPSIYISGDTSPFAILILFATIFSHFQHEKLHFMLQTEKRWSRIQDGKLNKYEKE